MAIRDLFSNRGRPVPPLDVLDYDVVPISLKVQIVHIWIDALGVGDEPSHYAYMGEVPISRAVWADAVATIRREHALFQLVGHPLNDFDEMQKYLLRQDPPLSVERVMDLLEVTFSAMESVVQPRWQTRAREEAGIVLPAAAAAAELNQRFLQHGVGYQYEAPRVS